VKLPPPGYLMDAFDGEKIVNVEGKDVVSGIYSGTVYKVSN